MSVAQRIFTIALVFLLAWGQLALARHVPVHATPGIDTCEVCVSQAQSSGGIVPPTVCLVVIADNGPFFQTHHQSHLPLLPARPQQARAPPFIA